MNVAHLYAPPSPTESQPEENAPIVGPIPFTLFGVIGKGWRTFRENAVRLTLVMTLGLLVSFAVGGVLGVVGELVGERLDGAASVLVGTVVPQTIGFVVGSFVSVGMLRISLAAARRQPVTASLLFSGFDATLPLIGAQLVATFLILCGTLCLVVPGIVLTIALSFAPLLVVDRRVGVFEAISLSQRLTRGRRGLLFALALANLVVLLLGLVAFGVGVLVAYTIVQLVSAHAYLHLIGEPS